MLLHDADADDDHTDTSWIQLFMRGEEEEGEEESETPDLILGLIDHKHLSGRRRFLHDVTRSSAAPVFSFRSSFAPTTTTIMSSIM